MENNSSAPLQWTEGEVILDLYRITGLLGEGGFGKVYKTRHLEWDIDLAIKTPKPERIKAAGGIEKFEEEAERWVNLGLHPHIVSCYYVRRIDGTPRVFAEYMTGGSLQDWIYGFNNRAPMLYRGNEQKILENILDIAIQVAWGLDYTHKNTESEIMIHQDIKPGNIMMTSNRTAKITDFGLSKSGRKAISQEDELTELGIITGGGGTPAYFSPEQAKLYFSNQNYNSVRINEQSDMFSFALCLLEMFKGERRWGMGNWVTGEDLDYYLNLESRHSVGIPPRVEILLSKCLKENPQERYNDMLTVANELKVIYEEELNEFYWREKPNKADFVADDLNNRAVSKWDLAKGERNNNKKKKLEIEALDFWNNSLDLEPQHPESIYNRGLFCWRNVKKIRKTDLCPINDEVLIQQLNSICKDNSNNWISKYLLASIHLERDDCQSAIESLNSINLGESGQDIVQELRKKIIARASYVNKFPISFWLFLINTDCLAGTLFLRDFTRNSLISTGFLRRIDNSIEKSNNDLLKDENIFNFLRWQLSTSLLLFLFLSIHFFIIDPLSKSIAILLKIIGKYIITPIFKSTDIEKVINRKYIQEETEGLLERELNLDRVSLSHDGEQILSGSYSDNIIRLWKTQTGECLKTFKGHTQIITSVVFSQDKKRALSGSFDQTMRLWNVETGDCLKIFTRNNRHYDWISSVVLSYNGELAISGEVSIFQNIKLWNISTDEYLQTFESKPTPMVPYSVAINSNNTLILSGHADATLRLWSITTEKCIQILGDDSEEIKKIGHQEPVSSVCFLKNDELALSGSFDRTLKLWDLKTGECLRTFEGHKDRVTSISVNGNEKLIFSSEASQTLKLWDLDTGKCLRTFQGHEDWVTSACLNFEGSLAVSSSHDGVIHVWKINSLTNSYLAPVVLSKVVKTENALEIEKFYRLKFLQAQEAYDDDNYTETLEYLQEVRQLDQFFYEPNVISLWGSLYNYLPHQEFQNAIEIKTYIPVENLKGISKKDQIKRPRAMGKLHASVHISQDSQYILVGRSRGLIFTLELLSFKELNSIHIFEGFESKLEELETSSNKLRQEWFQKERNSTFEKIKYSSKLTSMASKSIIESYYRPNTSWSVQTCVCLSADNRFIMCGHELGRIKLWNVEKKHWIWTFRGHEAEVKSLCMSSDNQFALSGSSDKTLRLWKIGETPEDYGSYRAVTLGDCLRVFRGHTNEVNSVCLSSDNQLALSGSSDRSLKLWGLGKENEIVTFSIFFLICNSLYRFVSIILEDYPRYCLQNFRGHTDKVTSVHLSIDNRLALSASSDTTIKLWDVVTGKCLRTFVGHTSQVNSISLSRDSSFILSGSDDRTARLWDIATGKCLHIFIGHTSQVTSVDLSKNNQWAITASGEEIKKWFLDWQLGAHLPTNADEASRAYLEVFLKQHTPYIAALPENKRPTEEEINLSIARQTIAIWKEKDFQDLISNFYYLGYGYLCPECLRQQLENMAGLNSEDHEFLDNAGDLDYMPLRCLLAASQWQEANEETWRLMQKAANSGTVNFMNIEDWKNFPSTHLQIINKLWVSYSNGHFGLSIQKQVFSEVTKSNLLPLSWSNWEKIGEYFGWKEDDNWKSDSELTFTLDAHRGYLPILEGTTTPWKWRVRFEFYSIFMSSQAWKDL